MMKKMNRKVIPLNIRKRILARNHHVCCVCKERGLGINYHHIDGNPSNNEDGNIAVLCVKEHDVHHRPRAYDTINHMEFGARKIKQYKKEWEQTVRDCQSDNPSVIAVINAYGTKESIHSAKLVMQNIKNKIIYQRVYHLTTSPQEKWIDSILEEVNWLGKKIKLTIINEPLAIEYCPCGQTSFSNTLDRNIALRITAKDWTKETICCIFINPKQPSLALTLFYKNELIYSVSLHKCGASHLHFESAQFRERTPINKKQKIRNQATNIIQKVINEWNPGKILIGTGNHDHPRIIGHFQLPNIWERNAL